MGLVPVILQLLAKGLPVEIVNEFEITLRDPAPSEPELFCLVKVICLVPVASTNKLENETCPFTAFTWLVPDKVPVPVLKLAVKGEFESIPDETIFPNASWMVIEAEFGSMDCLLSGCEVITNCEA